LDISIPPGSETKFSVPLGQAHVLMAVCILFIFFGTLILIEMGKHWWRRWRPHLNVASLPPGSLGLPLIGTTLELIRNPNLYVASRMEVAAQSGMYKSYSFGRRSIVLTHVSHRNAFADWIRVGLIVRDDYSRAKAVLPGFETLWENRDKVMSSLTDLFSSSSIERCLSRILKLASTVLEDLSEESQKEQDGFLTKARTRGKLRAFSSRVSILLLFGDLSHREQRYLAENIESSFWDLQPTLSTLVTLCGVIRRKMEFRDNIKSALRQIRSEHPELEFPIISRLRNHGMKLEEDKLNELLIAVVLVGTANIASVLSSILHFTGKDQGSLASIREEVRHWKLVHGQELTLPALKSQLPFLQKVVQESVRLNFPVFMTWGVIQKDFRYKGYLFPKGWTVGYSPWMAHRCSGEDAFQPRMLGRSLFGLQQNCICSGPVMGHCPGEKLGLIAVKVFVITLAEAYTFAIRDSSLELLPQPQATFACALRKREAIEIPSSVTSSGRISKSSSLSNRLRLSNVSASPHPLEFNLNRTKQKRNDEVEESLAHDRQPNSTGASVSWVVSSIMQDLGGSSSGVSRCSSPGATSDAECSPVFEEARALKMEPDDWMTHLQLAPVPEGDDQASE